MATTHSLTPSVLHSSSDFARVAAQLEPRMPAANQLIHRNVLGTGVATDPCFSEARRHLVRTVDLPSVALSMTLGGLKPGQATRKHRHSYETIIYVLQGRGVSTIESEQIHWQEGDAFYVPPWAWHQHSNLSEDEPALYVACENAPMLQNLGAAQREEA